MAEGIIQAVKELGVQKKIVMRIKGNKAKEAKELVSNSKLELFWFDDVSPAV